MPDCAHTTFKKTITRASGMLDAAIELLEFHKDIEEDKSGSRPTWDLNRSDYLSDIARASLVFEVAAMDRYFTDRFTEAVMALLRDEKPTKGLIDVLESAGLTTGMALELLSMQRPYRRIRSLVERYYSNYVTQSFEKIDDLYNAVGLTTFSKNIERKAHRKTLCKAVQGAVHARHRIVHAADLNKHKRLNIINDKNVRRNLEQITRFVETAESIILNRMRSRKRKRDSS
jgi:hypothetical protein